MRRRGSETFFKSDSPIKKILAPIIISYRLRELLSEAPSSVSNIFPRAIRYLRPCVYKSSSGVQDGRLVGSAAARARCYSVGQASKVCFGVWVNNISAGTVARSRKFFLSLRPKILMKCIYCRHKCIFDDQN